MTATVIMWGFMGCLAVAAVVLGRMVRRAKRAQSELLRLAALRD